MKKSTCIILLFASLLFVTCKKEITMSTPVHKPKLVLNALFSPDSVFKVRIRQSEDVVVALNRKFPTVADASVQIWEEGNKTPLDLMHVKDGLYQPQGYDPNNLATATPNMKPQTSKRYTIQAQAAGFLTVTGSDQVPIQADVQGNLTLKKVGENLQATFTINDPIEQDYYRIEAFYTSHQFGGGKQDWNKTELTTIPLKFSLAKILNPLTGLGSDLEKKGYSMALFTDNAFNGRKGSIAMEFRPEFLGSLQSDVKRFNNFNKPETKDLFPALPQISIRLYKVSQAYFNYFFSIKQQRERSITTSSVSNHIQHGFGLFGAYSLLREITYTATDVIQ